MRKYLLPARLWPCLPAAAIKGSLGRSQQRCTRLLGAAEHLSRERGKTALFTRASSSSWHTIDALTERGYQPLGLMTRMKAGENPSYDHADCYYLDSWL